MTAPLRVAMLLSDAYGGFGGVARFNRNFLAALDASPLVARVDAFPRLIAEAIDEPIPESVVFHRRAARGAAAFLTEVARWDARGSGLDLVICGHINLLAPAYALARRRGAKLALIIHGVDAWAPGSHRLANRLAATPDLVISVSSHTARLFQAWSGAPDDRIALLPNCVDLSAFAPAPRDAGLAARYGLDSAQVLLTVARLDPRERYKGIDEVIDLLPELIGRHPTLKYLIVGDGGDRERLRAKAANQGLGDRVVFAGRVDEAEKTAHYNLADVYVMPGRGEGFGIVYLEAAACGVPVIGSILDGSRDALLEGRLGALADPRAPATIVAAIETALARKGFRERSPELATFGEAPFRMRVGALLETLTQNAHRKG